MARAAALAAGRGFESHPARAHSKDRSDMDERSDAALVAEALAGQREAFATLVRRYQDCAYGVAIGILSDFELARDVVQEAFLSAYRDLRKLRDADRFPGWLCGIVRHMAHRALRELARVRSMTEDLSQVATPFDPTPAPDEAAEDAERRELVRRALASLSDRNREAVSLYYVDGLSYTEIASFLGVTETAVQGRLQRGRAQLRKGLMKMVEDTFKEQELPADFSVEIKRLLDLVAEHAAERERAIRRLAEIGTPAVDPLCEAIGDPREPVRIAAARALCAIGDARALRPILRLLYSDMPWRYSQVFEDGSAIRVPGAREALLEIVRGGQGDQPNWRTEASALCALAHAVGDDEVFDCVYRIFRAPRTHTSVARAAMNALCDIRPDSAVKIIEEALHSPNLRVRAWAARLAVHRSLLPSIEACVKAFVGGICSNDRRCAVSLARQHGKAGEETLQRLMRSGMAEERATAALVLAQAGHDDAFDVLKREIFRCQPDRTRVREMAHALTIHYGGDITSWLEMDEATLAGTPGFGWALSTSRGDVTPMAERLYRAGTPAGRAAALRILARDRGTELLPELRCCLREAGPGKVTREAFRQMRRLRDAALPTALEMFESEEWTERKAATCLLRRWGKLTPEQKQKALADPHVAVRHAAG